MKIHNALRHLFLLAVALVLSSCATHTPRAVYVTPLTAVISQGDGISTQVSTTDARMSEEERQMLGDRITQAVQTLAQPGSGTPNQYELEVNITRYTKGSGFVRTAMPGTFSRMAASSLSVLACVVPRRMLLSTLSAMCCSGMSM